MKLHILVFIFRGLVPVQIIKFKIEHFCLKNPEHANIFVEKIVVSESKEVNIFHTKNSSYLPLQGLLKIKSLFIRHEMDVSHIKNLPLQFERSMSSFSLFFSCFALSIRTADSTIVNQDFRFWQLSPKVNYLDITIITRLK